MRNLNYDKLEDEHCHWLEENCECKEECLCADFDKWLDEHLRGRFEGMEEEDIA